MLPGGRTGVWTFTDGLSAPAAAAAVAEIEQLGFSTVWLPETVGRDPFAHIAHLLDATDELVFATGIANVYLRHPGVMKQVANTLAEQSDNRFVLGLGVSHERTVSGIRGLPYQRPLAYLTEYLTDYAAAPYRGPEPAVAVPVVLAALGPKMHGLAADSADGVLSFSTSPEHTARARELLGPSPMLCVEQKIVLSATRETGLGAARAGIGGQIALPNYRRVWQGLGFTAESIDTMDETFLDGIIAIGNADIIVERVAAHYRAGASHVCIQPLRPDGISGPDLKALRELAPLLTAAP